MMTEMARTVAVSRVFRAVVATTMAFSTVLAVTAIGGVLRRTMGRMLGVGNCTAAFPISPVTITSRITVFQFVASGIKNGKIWLSSLSEEGPG